MSNRALLTTTMIALLAIFLSEATISPLRQLTGALVYPLSRPLTELTQAIRSIASTVRSIGTLRHEAQRLADENRILQAKIAELEAVRRENETLSQALSFQQRTSQSLIATRIVGRSPDQLLQSVEVDRGEADGVQVGAPVIADGFLVGLVSRRSPHRATVQLITASSAQLAVVFTRSRAQGILRGGLDGLVATQVPLDITVEPDEPVVTSGLGGILPPDIPVGQAGERRSLSSSILQEIRVSSPIRFSKLELVFIGQPAPAAEAAP